MNNGSQLEIHVRIMLIIVTYNYTADRNAGGSEGANTSRCDRCSKLIQGVQGSMPVQAATEIYYILAIL